VPIVVEALPTLADGHEEEEDAEGLKVSTLPSARRTKRRFSSKRKQERKDSSSPLREMEKRSESRGVRGITSPPSTYALLPRIETASEDRWRGMEGVTLVQVAESETMRMMGVGGKGERKKGRKRLG